MQNMHNIVAHWSYSKIAFVWVWFIIYVQTKFLQHNIVVCPKQSEPRLIDMKCLSCISDYRTLFPCNSYREPVLCWHQMVLLNGHCQSKNVFFQLELISPCHYSNNQSATLIKVQIEPQYIYLRSWKIVLKNYSL